MSTRKKKITKKNQDKNKNKVKTKVEVKKQVATASFKIRKPKMPKIQLKAIKNLTSKIKLRLPSKMTTNKVFILVKKELSNYFSTPVAYVVFSLFSIVLGILLFGIGKYTQLGSADLTQMFTYIAFAFIIIIPALTMGSIAKEKQNGTIEYILTQPITELQFLISKFISYAILVLLMLLCTLPIAIFVQSYSGLDVGQTIMQYIGGYILGLCFVSIGIAVSALFKSEIAAFLTSIVVSALFIIIGTDVFTFSATVGSFLEKFSLLTHFQSISRGVLDLRDILFFFGFLLAALTIAYLLIIKDKYPVKHKYLRYTQVATVIIVVTSVVIGYIGQIIPGRIDFTSNQRYTLSSTSQDIINKVKDVMNVTFYNSSNLPPEFQNEIRNVQDILRDYSTSSGGKIVVTTKQPDTDQAVLKEAQADGITAISFNVNTSDSASTVVGYFGIVFKYLDKSEVLNLSSENIGDLEYQITKKVKKISDSNPKKIAFVSNNVAHPRTSDLTTLSADLTEFYTVSDISLTKDSTTIPADVQAVVIVGPSQQFDSTVITALKDYYDKGGSIFLLTNPVGVDSYGTASANQYSLNDLLQDYGVTVNQDLAYDLQQNNVVAQASSFSPIIFNYPLWLITNASSTNISILKEIPNVSLLWASSLSLDLTKAQDQSATIYKLLETTSSANTQTGTFDVSFGQTWAAKSSDKILTMAAAVENKNGGRAVVVGDSSFISDQMLPSLAQRQSQDKQSVAFALNSIAWLIKDDSIGSIISKSRVASPLSLQDWQSSLMIGASVGVPIAIIVGIGTFVYLKRRSLLKKKFVIED